MLTPTDAWPRLDRFKEHDIELPVAELDVTTGGRRELADALARAVELGRNMVRVLPVDLEVAEGRRCGGRRALFHGARLPVVQPQLRAARSAPVLVQLALRLVPECFGTGVELADFDDEQSGEEAVWTDADGRRGRPARRAPGERLKPEALAVRFHGETIAEVTARSVADSRMSVQEAEARGARARDRARRRAGARRAGSVFSISSAWVI